MLVSESIAPPSPFGMRWRGLELTLFAGGSSSLAVFV